MFALVYLIIVLIEAGVRYAGWVFRLFSGHDAALMRQQILGSTLHNFVFLGFCLLAITAPSPTTGGWRFAARLLLDYVAASATTLNLISWWQVSRGYSNGDCLLAIVNRVGLALAITAAWVALTG